MHLLTDLRQQHPRFIYNSYQVELTSAGLKITHHFQIESTIKPDLEFHPTVTIEGVTATQWEAIPQELRDNWVFHLGLAEIPSYWKATASPEIIIKAGYLNPEQIAWWHKLLIKGMGEYFYVNQINFTEKNFVTWRCAKTTSAGKQARQVSLTARQHTSYLVPLGGGKDSALTTCILNQQKLPFDVFLLNPTPAMKQIAQIASPEQIITAKRLIDPKLLELNHLGYLNGHVPFSANIAFLARLTGLIFSHQSVVISNERSSNEGNVQFLGTEINHQYSKTYEFEQDFEQYVIKHKLMPKQNIPSFFSLLRPLYELQISKLFINCDSFKQYATVFKSCNKGRKTNSWCGECPKCLFTFTSLYPFMTKEKLISIFGQNLFEKKSLLDEAMALLGKTKNKPFECVGTNEESTVAFYLCIEKIRSKNQPLPALLQLIWDQILQNQPNLPNRATKILSSWNTDNQLPDIMKANLKNAITKT